MGTRTGNRRGWERYGSAGREAASGGDGRILGTLLAVGGLLTCAGVQAEWTHYAGNPRRQAVASNSPADLGGRAWTLSRDRSGQTLVFDGPTGPVAFEDRLYVVARHYQGAMHTANKVVCVGRGDGEIVFETLVDRSELFSWAAPAVDVVRRCVIVGSGRRLVGVDADVGGVLWETPLDRPIVNASPCVGDGPAAGRVFISDYDGFGATARLNCVNTAANNEADNPWAPGAIVWSEVIGASSGNTAAYFDGAVYVAAEVAGGEAGRVYAFDVGAGAEHSLRWVRDFDDGFFGGVCYVEGFVYAATYDFYGTGNNSELVKIDAADGRVAWTTPCERTQSIPIVVGNRIYLAAGLQGFGSAPKVQTFADEGDSARLLWDSHVATGGALVVGGWTCQPVLSEWRMYVGTIPRTGNLFGPYTDLWILDIRLTPGDAGFVVDHVAGLGSSAAVCNGRLYSIGPEGLGAVGALGEGGGGGARGHMNGDGAVNGGDVAVFVRGVIDGTRNGLGDFDGNGVLDAGDVVGFVERLAGT